MNNIQAILSRLEPEVAAANSGLTREQIAQYSLAISMKRLADFFAAFEARIETSMALDEKSNGSEH